MPRSFRDYQVAAPLKRLAPVVAHSITGVFPRLSSRGPIEAWKNNRERRKRSSFRDYQVAAPLKRREQTEHLAVAGAVSATIKSRPH